MVFFYAVQVHPHLEPNAVVFGFAIDIQFKLRMYHRIAHSAKLLSYWPCKPEWVPVAIESITRTGCSHITETVYMVDSLENIKERAQAFFDLMPILNDKTL